MRAYTPPKLPTIGPMDTTIFLGGSIEMGVAEEWQNKIIQDLQFLDDSWVVLNPRRENWDSSWKQSIENPHFYQQVDWEMTYLGRADYKIFYFSPGTMSPITLLELGSYGQYNSFVICPEGYQRRGNVEIFCHKKEIPFYNSLDEVVEKLRKLSSS